MRELLTGLGILSYYAVIAGKVVAYCVSYAQSLIVGAPSVYGGSATSTLVYFSFFLVLTVLVVVGGVQRGIERWAKILMPILLALMLLVIVRGLTLPGAGKGLAFYLKPDFSVVTGKTILAALGQAFFSLSLGMGAMITYGSYLPKTADLQKSGLSVALFDTLIALMAET